jgi:hypothetical protein
MVNCGFIYVFSIGGWILYIRHVDIIWKSLRGRGVTQLDVLAYILYPLAISLASCILKINSRYNEQHTIDIKEFT